jgi:hypothetical protein
VTLSFGAGGNGEESVLGGWSAPERKFRWMTRIKSGLRIDQRFELGDYLLELELRPFLAPPKIGRQRLSVAINGIEIAQVTIEREGRYGFRIPAAALGNRRSHAIVLTHPDAVRPADLHDSRDTRLLSIAVARLRISPVRAGASGRLIVGTGGIPAASLEQRVGMDAARFILNFESLGNNCEFGLVQRQCGAEPFFSLLRFAGMELPTLLRALELGMADFGDEANVEVRVDDKPRPEFVVHENRYGVFFHTFRYQDETRAETVLVGERKRLAYCAQRLLGDFRKGNKIFVFKRNERLRDEEIFPLYAALATFGDVDLLVVVPSDAEHSPGCVEVVLPGLYRGYVERFAPMENAPDLLLDDWLEVCANAWNLRLSEKRRQREPVPSGN